MKRIIATIALTLSISWCSMAVAQENTTETNAPKDTLKINFLKHTDPGDILPFKYIYQRAKISSDTTITCAVSKDIELEILENNKEDEYVVAKITQSGYKKNGKESLSPDYYRVNYVAESLPVEITIDYDGTMYGTSDSLVARAIRNLHFVSDTLSKSQANVNGISREEIFEAFSYIADTAYVMRDFVTDLSNLFIAGIYQLAENESYSITDSLFCNIDNKKHQVVTTFGWDQEASEENDQLKPFYVIRLFSAKDPMLFIEGFDSEVSEDEAKKLIEKYGRRLLHVSETTILADKAMGIPVMVETDIVDGFYEKLGDDYISLAKIIIALDYDKLMAMQDGDEDEEDEEDGETRYDDYGFIKVK